MKVGDLLIDESESVESFVRSSGPGGQNVNKVASAVELRFDARRSPSLPDAVVGAAYSAQLDAAGLFAPLTWQVAPGSLPAGRTLASDGTISGQATVPGSYEVSVSASDARAPAQSASELITLTVDPAG